MKIIEVNVRGFDSLPLDGERRMGMKFVTYPATGSAIQAARIDVHDGFVVIVGKDPAKALMVSGLNCAMTVDVSEDLLEEATRPDPKPAAQHGRRR